LKVAVASMMQETNTFSHLRTEYEDFLTAKGEEVYGADRWKRHSVMGIIETLKAGGIQVVPTFIAIALPGGLIKKEAFEKIVSGIVGGIKAAKPVDGVCLALHGSMAAEGYDDPEGALLTQIRREIGWEIPVTCSLDMHTTMTETMVLCANGYSAYRTAPHMDQYETGARAAKILLAAMESGKKVLTKMVKLPVLIAGEQTESDVPPMKTLIDSLQDYMRLPFVLDASYVLGYPWADSPHAGVAALVAGFEEESQKLAQCVQSLTDAFEKAQNAFTFTTEAHPLDKAVEIALSSAIHPVVISDSGDNPTAGAAQDLAIAAKELIDRKADNAIVIAIADRASWEACKNAGAGSKVKLHIGRLNPYIVTPPSPLDIEVEILLVKHAGSCDYAVVKHEGVTIVLSRSRVSVAEPHDMRELEIKLEEYNIICVKCGYLDPTYKAFAAKSILALTPGYTCELLDTLPYKLVPRPIFPLDR
jgi:microcystin degradation protein MlrC